MRWLSRSDATVDLRGTAQPDRVLYDCATDNHIMFSSLETGEVIPSPFHHFLIEVGHLLQKSPIGLALFHQASNQGYAFRLSSVEEAEIDPFTRTLSLPDYNLNLAALLRSPYFRTDLIYQIFRGLRLIDQYERGVLAITHRPDQAVLYARARAADIETISLHIAHDLRFVDAGLWRHLLSGEVGDMARICTQAEYRPINDWATRFSALFLSWYNNPERVNEFDHNTLNDLDIQVVAQNGSPETKNTQVIPAQYRTLCQIPTRAGSYLTLAALQTLAAPETQTMADDTNAAHLHHIVRDAQTLVIYNVAFRDKKLARMIFPDAHPID